MRRATAGASKRHNRSFGKRSPLDKLPDEVRKELARRCHGDETLAQIRQWLLEKHGVKISIQAVSDWWARRIAAGYESRAVVAASSFEIFVTALGAESIIVRVLPLQPGAEANQPR